MAGDEQRPACRFEQFGFVAFEPQQTHSGHAGDERIGEPPQGLGPEVLVRLEFVPRATVGPQNRISQGLTFGVANSALAGPIRLGIRPESLMIGKGAAGVPLNRFAAVVVALDFRGSYARATLIPDAAPHLRLLADFASDVLAMQELHPGAGVEAAVSPDALLIFPNLARGGT